MSVDIWNLLLWIAIILGLLIGWRILLWFLIFRRDQGKRAESACATDQLAGEAMTPDLPETSVSVDVEGQSEGATGIVGSGVSWVQPDQTVEREPLRAKTIRDIWKRERNAE